MVNGMVAPSTVHVADETLFPERTPRIRSRAASWLPNWSLRCYFPVVTYSPGTISTIDYHTAGEPFRIVVEGAPEILGATVLERREFATHGDANTVRLMLCNEPRGHADMYGCFIIPPNDPGAVFGTLFWHKDGFSTACGHGTIALAVYAVDEGLVAAPNSGDVSFDIDVPSGRVNATVHRDGGRTTSVTFRNVASYVIAQGVEVATSIGTILVDVSYGGAIYASAQAGDLGLAVVPEHLTTLIAIGREIKSFLSGRPEARHPSDDRLSGIYGTIWFDELGSTPTGIAQRNCTVFADGEVDRSPCGSGTSARLAILHATGQLATGDTLTHDSVIGSTFRGRVLGPSDVPASSVITQIEGMAYRSGQHSFALDPHDPIGLGFQLR